MYADMNIKKYIEKYIDDPYAMEVLYYHVRKVVTHTKFGNNNADGFNIDGRFLGKDIELDLPKGKKSLYENIGFVLSVRALIIKPQWLSECTDNYLLFPLVSHYSLSWLSHRVINDCMDDEIFRGIFNVLMEAVSNDVLSEETKQAFKDNTRRPEYRNISTYYNNIDKSDSDNYNRTIKPCYYLLNDRIEDYIVRETVEYIGDTAFAYCPNLKSITFLRRNTLFGKFPIIECPKLEKIVVPTDSVEYYKKELPYYSDIIISEEANLTGKERIPNEATQEEPSSQTTKETTTEPQSDELQEVDPKVFKSAFKQVMKDVEKESMTESIKIKYQSAAHFVQFYSSRGQRSFNMTVFGKAFADFCKNKALKSIEEYYEGIREFGVAEKAYYNTKFMSIIERIYKKIKRK